MRDYEGILVVNEPIASGIYRAEVICAPLAGCVEPGQFVLVGTGDGGLPLLRPLSVSAVMDDRFEMIYRVVGEGTQRLAGRRPGERLTVRGSAGCAFEPAAERLVIALAGTLGVAPLLFWRQRRGPFEALLLGVPDGSWKPYAEWVASRVPEMAVFCDTGEFGQPGFCVEGLKGRDLTGRSLVACGPNPMLRTLYNGWGEGVTDMQVSLEKRMGCGMGGCFGCVVNLRSGRRRLCVDGPVMQAREVKWDELHL